MRGQELTLYEREKIELHLRGEETIRGIGRMLHRDHSDIVRELQRNPCPDGIYRAAKAQEYADARKRRKRKKKLEKDEDLKLHVIKEVLEDQSPEQISGRLKKRLEPSMIGKGISPETIYQFIYEGQGRFMGLYQHLRRGRKKRQRRYSRKQRGKQPVSFITPLQYRPAEINEKKEFGHWESDTTACESKEGAVSVQYERSIQFAHLTKVQDKSAAATDGALRELIESLPVKSFTFDRGGEGADHWKLGS